jgi:hypothetical protein
MTARGPEPEVIDMADAGLELAAPRARVCSMEQSPRAPICHYLAAVRRLASCAERSIVVQTWDSRGVPPGSLVRALAAVVRRNSRPSVPVRFYDATMRGDSCGSAPVLMMTSGILACAGGEQSAGSESGVAFRHSAGVGRVRDHERRRPFRIHQPLTRSRVPAGR